MLASGKLGRLPSPLWVGGGGRRLREWSCITAPPPSPPLPHKGGGSRPSTRPEQQHEGGEKDNVGGGIRKAARRPLHVLHQARAAEHADRNGDEHECQR